MSFSKRMGIVPAVKELQLTSMDKELKNCLWNVFSDNVLDQVKYSDTGTGQLHYDLAAEHFKIQMHTLSPAHYQIVDYLVRYYDVASWNQVYDLLDFFIGKRYVGEDYTEDLNYILEREFSGYRVVNNMIVPISNEVEIESITEALNSQYILSNMPGVNVHLSKAINLLSDRDYPDYGNSIKESISAVESATRELTGENTLGSALNSLVKKGVPINAQLRESFTKVYAYTNDKTSGIRHSKVSHESFPPDFETAKYLLVASSAFINYLVGIASKV